MDFTVYLCSERDPATGELKINTKKYFEIIKQDTTDVILLINYYAEKAQSTTQTTETKKQAVDNHGIKRVRVNDKTASGGWY